jgi:hypothetical protein
MRTFTLSDGTSVTRRDHDFDIGVRRKDLRAADDKGGVLILDDAHQLEPGTEKGARQVRGDAQQEEAACSSSSALVLHDVASGGDSGEGPLLTSP